MHNIYLSLKVKRKKSPCSKKCVNFEKKFLDQLIFGRLALVSDYGFADIYENNVCHQTYIGVIFPLERNYLRNILGSFTVPNKGLTSINKADSVSQRAQWGADVKMVIANMTHAACPIKASRFSNDPWSSDRSWRMYWLYIVLPDNQNWIFLRWPELCA